MERAVAAGGHLSEIAAFEINITSNRTYDKVF
jgi:hypothetical protein